MKYYWPSYVPSNKDPNIVETCYSLHELEIPPEQARCASLTVIGFFQIFSF